MASFEEALVKRLLADGDLSAAIGTKIHWATVPQDTPLPYIRLQVVSAPDETDLKGGPTGGDVRVQVDCFAKNYGVTRQLARMVKAALRSPALVEGVQFGRAEFAGPRDVGADLEGSFVHRALLECAIWHQASE